MYLIDTDPGIDDAHALAMAFAHLPPEDVMVSTVAGNVGLAEVTRNARLLVGAMAPEVAVTVGAGRPILGEAVAAAHIHGADGLAGFRWPQEAPLAPLAPEPAAVAILDAARRYGNDLTIVALGPLTNLAIALLLDPELGGRVGRVVAMGGSPAGLGNASVNAEFNVFADPAAAEIVYRAIPLTLITWDLTQRYRYAAAEIRGFFEGDSAPATVMRAIDEHRRSHDARYAAADDVSRVDPLAMAIALDPTIVTEAAEHAVVVGYGGLGHGYTAVDWQDMATDRVRLRIPTTIDRDRAAVLFAV